MLTGLIESNYLFNLNAQLKYYGLFYVFINNIFKPTSDPSIWPNQQKHRWRHCPLHLKSLLSDACRPCLSWSRLWSRSCTSRRLKAKSETYTWTRHLRGRDPWRRRSSWFPCKSLKVKLVSYCWWVCLPGCCVPSLRQSGGTWDFLVRWSPS